LFCSQLFSQFQSQLFIASGSTDSWQSSCLCWPLQSWLNSRKPKRTFRKAPERTAEDIQTQKTPENTTGLAAARLAARLAAQRDTELPVFGITSEVL
jgi:hypothetical protein